MAKEKVMDGLCPGCGDHVTAAGMEWLEDWVGRPWHRGCARRSLAHHFRTPLSPVEASAEVSFECSDERFTAPHSFHLREIILVDDIELSGLFVGQHASVCAFGTTIRPRDVPERRFIIDRDVPMGVTVTAQGVAAGARWRLIGERRPEDARPRAHSPQMIAVAPINSGSNVVGPGKTANARFFMPAKFRGERVVCDDWKSWEVVRVLVGTDPGTAVAVSRALTGHSTELPTYVSQIGEPVTYEVKNISRVARKFIGRAYGTCT